MQIEELRSEIDKIDDEIMRLLTHRANVALEIAEAKHRSGQKIHSPKREREIIDRARRSEYGSYIGDIFAHMISATRTLMYEATENY